MQRRSAIGSTPTGAFRHRLARKSGLVAALVTSALVVSGCASAGGGDEGPAPADSAVDGELTFLVQGSASAEDATNELLEGFKAAYPDVEVNTEYSATSTWDTFFTDLQTKIAGGKKYDLIYIPTEGQRLFASKGIVQPLDEWIERDSDELEDFYNDANEKIVDFAREKSSTDGQTYYLPYGFNTMGIYYNKKVFDEAGVEYPAADWTWEDFRATAEAVNSPGERFAFEARPGYFDGIMPWLLSNGGDILNSDWDESVANSPENVEAVEFVTSLVDDGLAPVPGGAYDQFAAFEQGKLAMFGGGAWPWGSLRDSGMAKEDIGIAPWPQNASGGSPVGWGSQAMLKDSQNKEAAWAYIKYLLTPEAQDLIAETQSFGIVPVRESSATGAVTTDNTPEGMNYLYEALDYAVPIPGPDQGLAVQQAVQDSYLSILTGNAQAAPALEELDATIADELGQ